MSIVIKNVLLKDRKTDIRIEENRINAIGRNAGEAEYVIDGTGKAALPGFINTHTHSAMTLLRSYADDLKLQIWLEKHIWPMEAKMTEGDVYWGARLACLEMIKSGTTCFNDNYWHLNGTLKAADESGMRAVIGEVCIDGGWQEKHGREKKVHRKREKGKRTRKQTNHPISMPACALHRHA